MALHFAHFFQCVSANLVEVMDRSADTKDGNNDDSPKLQYSNPNSNFDPYPNLSPKLMRKLGHDF